MKTNAFIFNLALFDFLIGTITWPMSVVFKLDSNQWIVESVFCDIWTCLDYILTRGSVLNVAMLALDRYLGMKMTSQYTVPYQTRNKVILGMILFTWILPIVVFLPANGITALSHTHEQGTIHPVIISRYSSLIIESSEAYFSSDGYVKAAA